MHWPASHDGCRSALCPRRQVNSCAAMHKWNSLQGGQVHYTDAAVGHQMTVGGLQLSSLLSSRGSTMRASNACRE